MSDREQKEGGTDTLIHKHTYDIRLKVQSWSFLWPEKWDWSTILNHRTNLNRDPLWNILKYDLLSLNIICNPAPFIHTTFQISVSRESRKKHYTLPIQPSDKKKKPYCYLQKEKSCTNGKENHVYTMCDTWPLKKRVNKDSQKPIFMPNEGAQQ